MLKTAKADNIAEDKIIRKLEERLRTEQAKNTKKNKINRSLKEKLRILEEDRRREMRLADIMNDKHEARHAELEGTIAIVKSELDIKEIEEATGGIRLV